MILTAYKTEIETDIGTDIVIDCYTDQTDAFFEGDVLGSVYSDCEKFTKEISDTLINTAIEEELKPFVKKLEEQMKRAIKTQRSVIRWQVIQDHMNEFKREIK